MKNSTIPGRLVPLLVTSLVTLYQLHAQEIVQPKALQLKNQLKKSNLVTAQQVLTVTHEGKTESVTVDKVPAQTEVIAVKPTVMLPSKQNLEVLKRQFHLEAGQPEINIIPELYVRDDASTDQVKLYGIAFVPPRPLQYNFEEKIFKGSLSFYLFEDPFDPSGTVDEISKPIRMEVTSSRIEAISPSELQVSKVYFPAVNIELKARNVSDSAAVRIRTITNPSGYETFVKVEPVIEIISNRETVQGYGIQEIPLTIRAIGSTSDKPIKVSFVGKGKFTPEVVEMHLNQLATVNLRSEGLGPSTIIAVASGFESNTLPVQFTFPLIFLLASVAGGSLGALVRNYGNKKKIALRSVLLGAAVGLLGAVAYYALGINLAGLQTNSTFNEFAVFGISALCAFFGIQTKQEAPTGDSA
jgi:hypothetical protein